MSGGSLEGLKVIDMTSVVVGPLVTQIMADHGADVIKVESKSGDVGRFLGGLGRTEGMSPKYLHLNRNKRSISLDLKDEAGRAVLVRLLESADVLLWNIRPASMERLGLSYEEVKRIKTDIIYCGMFGFGQDGCYRDMPAYDPIIQGVSGVADLNRRMTGAPAYVPYVLADRTTGLIAVQLIAMALFKRERTGQGQSIEVPMYENMVTQVMTEHMYLHTFEPPIGPFGDPRILDPLNSPIPTLDGYICISANTNEQVFAFFDLTGRPELKSDERFSSISARFQNVKEYFSIRNESLRSKTTTEWMKLFSVADIPAAPFNTLESLQDDPHLLEAGMFERVEHPTEGPIWNIRPANKMSGGMRQDFFAAPNLGQDTQTILLEAGYTEQEVAALIASGVAQQHDSIVATGGV